MKAAYSVNFRQVMYDATGVRLHAGRQAEVCRFCCTLLCKYVKKGKNTHYSLYVSRKYLIKNLDVTGIKSDFM